MTSATRTQAVNAVDVSSGSGARARGIWSGLGLAIALPAAVDTILTRLDHPHRPTEFALFGQSLLMWAGYAALAVVPTLLTRALGSRLGWRWSTAPSVLLFWTVAPVLAHAQLDRHTSLGGNLAALSGWRPWAEVAGALLALIVVLAILGAISSSKARAAALFFATLLCGAFLPPGVGADGRGDVQSAPGSSTEPDSPGAGAATGERNNVLLLVWDTTRAQSLPMHGNPRNVSPHLADFAQDALVFEMARSASVFTFSSHLSMLTGAYPTQHGGRQVHMRHDPERATSVARRLRDAGYRTGAFVGTGVLAAHTGINDGFEVYDDLVDPPVCDTRGWSLIHDLQSVLSGAFPALRRNGRPHWIQDFQRPADGVLESAAEWIASEDERPWFCMVNLYDAHWPYLPNDAGRSQWVEPYDGPMDGFGSRANSIWGSGYEATDADARHMTELYEAEIWELDAKVAAFLAKLDPAEDAVLVTADHGEAFGEAGVWEHDELYEPQVRVPFILRVPGGLPSGSEGAEAQGPVMVPGPVTGVDVAPTLLGAAGLQVPEELLGLDLTRKEPPLDRPILVEDRDLLDPSEYQFALYLGHWKLEESKCDGTLQVRLFDLRNDAVGDQDVAPQHPEVVEDLRERLHSLRAALGAGDADDSGALDGASMEALRALGYLDE